MTMLRAGPGELPMRKCGSPSPSPSKGMLVPVAEREGDILGSCMRDSVVVVVVVVEEETGSVCVEERKAMVKDVCVYR